MSEIDVDKVKDLIIQNIQLGEHNNRCVVHPEPIHLVKLSKEK